MQSFKNIIISIALVISCCGAMSAASDESPWEGCFPEVKATLNKYDNVYGRRLTDGWTLARIVAYPMILAALLTRDYCADLPNDHEPKGFWGEVGGTAKHACKVFGEIFSKPQEIFKKHRLIRIATLLVGIESGAFGYFKWKKSGDMKAACEKDFPGLETAVQAHIDSLPEKMQERLLEAGENQEEIKGIKAGFEDSRTVLGVMLNSIRKKDNDTVLRIHSLI